MRLVIVQNILRDYNHWMFRDLATVTGLDVVVVYGESPPENRKFSSVVNPSIPCRCLPTRQWVLPEMILSRMVGLAATLRELAPDVVMVEGESNFINNETVRRYCMANGVPFVWWSMGKWSDAPIWNPRRRLLHALVVGRQLRQAAVILAYSNAGAAYYRAIGIPEAKVRVAVNFLSDAFWAPVIEQARDGVPRVRKELALEGKVSLLLTGTLVRSKGVGEFLRCFELAKGDPELASLCGVVMGDGPERAALEAHARELGLPVTFTGWLDRERASEVLLACDASVSLGHGGLNLSQAMIHGRAILTGPADGTERDLIADGENGCLLPDGTAESLLAALRRLQAAGGDWNAMGAASLRRHRERYNITQWARSVEAAAEAAVAARE